MAEIRKKFLICSLFPNGQHHAKLTPRTTLDRPFFSLSFLPFQVKALKEGGQADAAVLAEKEKKVGELSEQIKVYKTEVEAKTKEFQHEREELQKVIREQKEQARIKRRN